MLYKISFIVIYMFIKGPIVLVNIKAVHPMCCTVNYEVRSYTPLAPLLYHVFFCLLVLVFLHDEQLMDLVDGIMTFE